MESHECEKDCLCVKIPNANTCIKPGYRIKIGRFSCFTWIVKYGWYAWAGNREVIGWYLVDINDKNTIKPLQKIDIDDIYIIDA